MTLAAFLLIFGGFACTALSMRRHYVQVFGSGLARRAAVVWRAVGWSLLGLALAPCIAQHGTSVGIVAWLGLLTAGALLITVLLTYRPRAVPLVAFVAPSLATLLLAVTRGV